MLILALDTSEKVASCALCRDGEIIAYNERDSMLDHSRTLLPVCQDMLATCGLELSDIDVFAATIGPGSFTGIRIGTAAIKGMAWALDKPCAGVSTLLSAAWNYQGKGRFCQCISALKSEYYYAMFESGAEEPIRISEDAVSDVSEIDMLGIEKVLGGQNAAGTAKAAFCMAKRDKLCSCHDINPSYLRATQAERMKAEKEKDR